jgi:hypothetical protein
VIAARGLDERAVLDAWSSAATDWATRCRAVGALAVGPSVVDQPWDAVQAALLRLADGDVVVTCPRCDEVADVELPLAALLAGRPGGGDDRAEGPLRVPTVGDLLEASRLDGAAACALLARRTGLDTVPEESRADALATLEDAHPLLAPSLDVPCPACGETFAATLDAVELAWGSLEASAATILEDVVTLATAFGWSEEDTLAVGPVRRRRYRQLASIASSS